MKQNKEQIIIELTKIRQPHEEWVAGDLRCPRCKKQHKIKFGTIEGKESKLLGFISCGKNDYLATLNGKLL